MLGHFGQLPDAPRRRELALPPLHRAVRNGELAIVEELVAEGGEAALTETDERGRLPLHLAASGHQNDMLIYVLDRTPEEALGLQDMKGFVPLRYALGASDEDNLSSLKTLIERGEPHHLLLKDVNGRNALHQACQLRKPSVVALVLDHIPREGLVALDQNHYTPAKHVALLFPLGLEKSLQILKVLPLEALTAKDSPGGDCAILTGLQGQGDGLLEHLLEIVPESFDYDSLTNSVRGFSVLHAYVSSSGPISAVGLVALLDRIPRDMVGASDFHGSNALHYLVRNCDDAEVIEVLLSRMTPEECAARTNDAANAVHLSCSPHIALLAAQRLQATALSEHRDRRGHTALVAVLTLSGRTTGDFGDEVEEAALWIIRNIDDEGLTRATLQGTTPLMAAAEYGLPRVAEELLQRLTEEHICAKDNSGCNVLHHCFQAEVSIPILELLLNNVPKALRYAENCMGQTPVSMAAGLQPSLANYFETVGAKRAFS